MLFITWLPALRVPVGRARDFMVPWHRIQLHRSDVDIMGIGIAEMLGGRRGIQLNEWRPRVAACAAGPSILSSRKAERQGGSLPRGWSNCNGFTCHPAVMVAGKKAVEWLPSCAVLVSMALGMGHDGVPAMLKSAKRCPMSQEPAKKLGSATSLRGLLLMLRKPDAISLRAGS